MIDYELYCKIQDYHRTRHLNVAQIARELRLDERTVARWLAADKFRPRRVTQRPSKLDSFKGQIVRWLENHPYTAAQILLRLREIGYTGGGTITKDYVRHVRPPQSPAFLTLAFAPGECVNGGVKPWRGAGENRSAHAYVYPGTPGASMFSSPSSPFAYASSVAGCPEVGSSRRWLPRCELGA